VNGDRTVTDGRARGTYTLLIGLAGEAGIEVGALGVRAFPAGWYAYTGSAFGSGGFSRIDRHRRVAAGGHEVRFWHIDYLLGHPAAGIDSATRSVGIDIECAVARALAGDRLQDFGASDCACDSHLAYAPERGTLSESIERAHAEAERQC
jgi:endonuclease-3